MKLDNIENNEDFNYLDSTDVDDLAYCLYLEKIEKPNEVCYTQLGFVNAVGSKRYYKKAIIILRKQKIKKIKSGI